jgi:hypothetical protein
LLVDCKFETRSWNFGGCSVHDFRNSICHYFHKIHFLLPAKSEHHAQMSGARHPFHAESNRQHFPSLTEALHQPDDADTSDAVWLAHDIDLVSHTNPAAIAEQDVERQGYGPVTPARDAYFDQKPSSPIVQRNYVLPKTPLQQYHYVPPSHSHSKSYSHTQGHSHLMTTPVQPRQYLAAPLSAASPFMSPIAMRQTPMKSTPVSTMKLPLAADASLSESPMVAETSRFIQNILVDHSPQQVERSFRERSRSQSQNSPGAQNHSSQDGSSQQQQTNPNSMSILSLAPSMHFSLFSPMQPSAMYPTDAVYAVMREYPYLFGRRMTQPDNNNDPQGPSPRVGRARFLSF